jgi:predicted O-linked N-acetylglucosamine transferase (SPINDLY family)
MLLKVFKRLAARRRPDAETLYKELQEAHKLAAHGDRRKAIKAYERYLQSDPSNLEALNGIAACLAEIGDKVRATNVFELAYAQDDTFVPAMVNYAKLLSEDKRAEEGLKILRRAKIAGPEFTHADAVFAGLCLRIGEATKARHAQLRAWLANFDNLRLGNCFIFWSSYDDIDEALVAAEHRFWAETVLVPDVSEPAEDGQDTPPPPTLPRGPADRRLRVGYWSPDLRNHSVRYFSRPLLDAHDRSRFEIFLYHDFPLQDGHTEAQRSRADHFHEVFDLTDAQLYRLIRSHDLDVLVDLAGHTSHNRVSLLAHRMARLQVNALGYPPTTGLSSVDAKIVDHFICTPNDARYYAEMPVALRTSFWCFDPKEAVPLDAEPPCLAKGYVTFGCVGNIAKISERIARSWARILDAVPGSRLLLRSITFEEPMAEARFREMLRDWGLPMDRLEFRQPEGGINLFNSYNEIDVILDTYPFNGGTTSCFATYMGVPVISLAGHSVVARMGASVLGNVGASDLVVTTLDEYVRRAAELAGDRDYLRRYKREIRDRLSRSGLGNEAIFAREFEQAIVELLDRQRDGRLTWTNRIDMLPAQEIMRRAYEVVRRGNMPAGRRITDHCLRGYPDYGPAHVLLAQMLVWDGQQDQALEQLQAVLPQLSPVHQVGAHLSIARIHLLRRDRHAAARTLAAIDQLPQEDAFDIAQARLYAAACSDEPAPPPARLSADRRTVRVLVPCDDTAWFKGMRGQIEGVLRVPAGWTVEFERCPEADRIPAYSAAQMRTDWDILVLMQKNVLIANPFFLHELSHALQAADVVSFAGATRWHRLEWRYDCYEVKAGGYLGGSGENADMVELQIVGPGDAAVISGMAVLDGRLVAMRRSPGLSSDWDEDLSGGQVVLEEAWVYGAGRQGARLAVHRGLGVFINSRVELDGSNRTEAHAHWADALGLDPFAEANEDFIALSVPVADAAEGVRVGSCYLKTS